MNIQQMPVHGGLPDAVKGPTARKIGAGFYLSQSDDVIGRIQTDPSRLRQPPNHAAQTLPACRFGVEASLGPRRLDYA
jgi:hypothetical protein